MDVIVQKYHNSWQIGAKGDQNLKIITITHNISSEGLEIHSNLIKMYINPKHAL